MAQNITLLGASYRDVPAVTLPKTGGGTAKFTDVSPTDTVESDVTAGKIFFKADGSQATGTNQGGGGGATNIVQGSFTTGSTRNSNQTVNIPYTGNGYPIMAMVYIKGGAYNNGSGGNTTWYNSVDRYDVGIASMVKARTTTAPTYSTSGADNYGNICYIYKNSTSSGTSYSRSSSMTANTYTSSSTSAASGNNCIRFKGNGKTLSVYIGNKSTSSYGFPPNTELEYIIVYSS